MRYVAAYLLATLGGNASPSAEDIKAILSSVGIDADKEKLKIVISELAGKKIDDIIAKGKEKLASVPSGGGVATASAGTADAGEAAAPKEEEKKEEKEDSDASDDDMGFGLFD